MITISVPVVVAGREETRTETVYTWDDLPLDDLILLRRYKKKGVEYWNIPAAFDIETTNIEAAEPFAFMYHWQFCINGVVCFGRTWEEFRQLLNRLRRVFALNEKRRLVIYIHNLAFEHVFLERFFPMTEVFARAPRKPIRELMDGVFELRCSYFLSNMSLKKFNENTPGAIYRKLSGDTYDYRKRRLPSTPMTEEELAYCYNDVRGLVECIEHALQEHRITSIPMTSTGYVRRIARKAVLANPKNKYLARRLALSPELYTLCRSAFRGGNTHADASYIEDCVTVDCYDLSSSYPAAMLLDKYPMSPFIEAAPERALLYLEEGFATIGRYRFEGVRHKQRYGIPYIDSAHCCNLQNAVRDNGRVLAADALELSLTDVDLKTILETYSFDRLTCSRLYRAEYDYLPLEFRQVVMHFFRLKSELKGDPDKIYEYNKSKNRLNALFGMLTTDIAAPEIVYKNGEWITQEADVERRLHEHYKSFGLFAAYQWGVWVTANARARLQRGISACIDELGDCAVAYTDTDSLKIRGGLGPAVIERLNAETRKLIDACPLPPRVTVGEKVYMMGLWDYEGRVRLKTYGAKKYLTADEIGNVEITVAGLNKQIGADSLFRMAGAENIAEKPGGHKARQEDVQRVFDAFRRGAVFNPSGRTTAYYNDAPPHWIEIAGERIETAASIAIIDTTYTLGVTGELAELVQLAHIQRLQFGEKAN